MGHGVLAVFELEKRSGHISHHIQFSKEGGEFYNEEPLHTASLLFALQTGANLKEFTTGNVTVTYDYSKQNTMAVVLVHRKMPPRYGEGILRLYFELGKRSFYDEQDKWEYDKDLSYLISYKPMRNKASISFRQYIFQVLTCTKKNLQVLPAASTVKLRHTFGLKALNPEKHLQSIENKILDDFMIEGNTKTFSHCIQEKEFSFFIDDIRVLLPADKPLKTMAWWFYHGKNHLDRQWKHLLV